MIASKRVAIRVVRDLLLTTAAGKSFATAPANNCYGDTLIGIWCPEHDRFRCIAGVAANGRVDPLGELLIDGKPVVTEWSSLPTDPFADAFR